MKKNICNIVHFMEVLACVKEVLACVKEVLACVKEVLTCVKEVLTCVCSNMNKRLYASGHVYLLKVKRPYEFLAYSPKTKRLYAF